MNRFFRIAAVLAGLVVLVFGLLALYFTLVFDPNDYRERLAAQVEARTGRELVIAGDIGVSVFPWLGIELADITLGNAPGFGDEPFAKVAQAQASVRLVPLLRREIEVDRVLLKGLQLKLERNAQGRTNWEDLGGGAAKAPSSEPAAEPARDAAAGVAALVVGGVEVDSARVEWNDRQKDVRYVVEDLDLRAGAFRPGESFPLSLSAQIASTQPALEGRLELAGEVTASPAEGTYAAEGLELSFSGRGPGLPGGAADLRAQATLAADLAQETLSVSDLVVTAYGLQASGAIQGKQILSEAAQFSGPLEVARFNPRELLKALGQTVPATTDPAVLTQAAAKARLDMGGGRLMLDAVELQLDDSRLTGTLGVADLAKTALRADLVLDGIDLDRYLPPSGPDAPAPVATPGVAAATAEPEGLRKLELQGRLRVGQLKVNGLRVADVDVNARAGGGVMRLHPLGAALYEGKYAGNVTLDARGRAMRVSLDETLQGVQIGPLLRDLSGKEERLTGRADLKARLQAAGSDAASIKRTLAGTAEFRFSDGAVKGVNVARFLREAEARLKGQPLPPASGPEQTDFSELSGTLRFADGVGRNDDLSAKSPLLRVSGSGSFDLVRERIDYLALASVVGTLTGQGGKELESLRGVTVPIRVGGSFEQPTYALDVERLLRENVKGQAKERLQERIGQELEKQKVDPQLIEGLKGLFR